jgi:peroxiredoxin Q/BCP
MALRDSAEPLAAFDAAVFMVSLDTPERNREFAESLESTQVLLSDASGATARAYGVTDDERRYARRWTFYIDREGVIREIDRDVSVETAGQDIARKLGELGFPRRSSAPPGDDASGR